MGELYVIKSVTSALVSKFKLICYILFFCHTLATATDCIRFFPCNFISPRSK